MLGIWYPLFILFFLLVPHAASKHAGLPLPTHKTQANSLQQRYIVHSTQICMMVSGRWAQSMSDIR